MSQDAIFGSFEWDKEKDVRNQIAHGISFSQAIHVFMDVNRIVVFDENHSQKENRWFCIGRVDKDILTVRFVYRKSRIRIYGAGKWRKGKRLYEKKT